jgi:hypothetical protein
LFLGDPDPANAGIEDGSFAVVKFDNLNSILYDSWDNTLYVTQVGYFSRIRKIYVDLGYTTTFSGSTAGNIEGTPSIAAQFNSPFKLVKVILIMENSMLLIRIIIE